MYIHVHEHILRTTTWHSDCSNITNTHTTHTYMYMYTHIPTGTYTLTAWSNSMSMYFPKRLELSLRLVLAFPNAYQNQNTQYTIMSNTHTLSCTCRSKCPCFVFELVMYAVLFILLVAFPWTCGVECSAWYIALHVLSSVYCTYVNVGIFIATIVNCFLCLLLHHSHPSHVHVPISNTTHAVYTYIPLSMHIPMFYMYMCVNGDRNLACQCWTHL